MACDALARYYRMQGDSVCFVTGTDEHGEKIAQAAAAAGREPQAHCDAVTAEFRALWQRLNIDYDVFVRTTQPQHAAIVRQFMQRVFDRGDIYRATYRGLYCTGCEEYKDADELTDHQLCPLHQTRCESRVEDNYFFRLSRYQHDIEQLLTPSSGDASAFVMPEERRNEVLGWVRAGLRDFSVSRAHNPWGLPVPGDDHQTVYVWFDALLGYVSALLADGQAPTLENAVARGWPAEVHVLGKDILRFHACYWPAMLLSAGLPLPKRLFSHGFLTKDGMKMSKSLGNTVDPVQLVDEFGADAVRYYFLRGIEFGRDGDYSRERFVRLVNADLANSIGNLLNRSLNLLCKHCEQRLPCAVPMQHELAQLARTCMPAAAERYAQLDFAGACEHLLRLSNEANVLIDREAPWKRMKQADTREDACRTLVAMLEVVRVVSTALWPIVPDMADRVLQALGLMAEDERRVPSWSDTAWGACAGRMSAGMPLRLVPPVFPRLPD